MTMNPPAQLVSTAGTVDPVSRAFFVGVGGSIQIAADQPEGDYNALFDVTANYQ